MTQLAITLVSQPEAFLAAKTVHLKFVEFVCQLKQELKGYNPKAFLTACKRLTANVSHLKATPLIPSEYLEYHE